MKKNSHQGKRFGLILTVLGLAIWALPFSLVALDNVMGNSWPADLVLGNFGLLIISIGPFLVVAGIAFLMLRPAKKIKSRNTVN